MSSRFALGYKEVRRRQQRDRFRRLERIVSAVGITVVFSIILAFLVALQLRTLPAFQVYTAAQLVVGSFSAIVSLLIFLIWLSWLWRRLHCAQFLAKVTGDKRNRRRIDWIVSAVMLTIAVVILVMFSPR